MLITVDTGGTKTLVAGFDASGSIASNTKFPTPKDQTQYIETLKSAITEVRGAEPIDAIVLALPGIIKDGTALWCNNLGWKDFPARDVLQKIFPGIDILVENDANLAGLGETRMLEPVPDSSLYVTFSTGVGTSLVIDGKLSHHISQSEGGHGVLEYEGQRKSWEEIASGKRLYETYGMYASEIKDPKIWDDAADRMSRGLLMLIPFMQPEVVIIGGSMGSYFDRYSHKLISIIDDCLMRELARPRIIAASHPEEAVIYGCYYYALDELATATPAS